MQSEVNIGSFFPNMGRTDCVFNIDLNLLNYFIALRNFITPREMFCYGGYFHELCAIRDKLRYVYDKENGPRNRRLPSNARSMENFLYENRFQINVTWNYDGTLPLPPPQQVDLFAMSQMPANEAQRILAESLNEKKNLCEAFIRILDDVINSSLNYMRADVVFSGIVADMVGSIFQDFEDDPDI